MLVRVSMTPSSGLTVEVQHSCDTDMKQPIRGGAADALTGDLMERLISVDVKMNDLCFLSR